MHIGIKSRFVLKRRRTGPRWHRRPFLVLSGKIFGLKLCMAVFLKYYNNITKKFGQKIIHKLWKHPVPSSTQRVEMAKSSAPARNLSLKISKS